MNKRQLAQNISIFIALITAGLLMILLPLRIEITRPAIETTLQNSLPLIGSALVSAGTVFFLLEMTRIEREKSS
jgi:2-keto-3-deoxy-6-phosphogluconate aldolase